MKPIASLACLTVTLGIAAPAIAGPFVSLPREDGVSKVGLDLGFTSFDDEFADGSALRLDPYFEYEVSEGLSGFANLPLATISGNGESESGIGNLSVGGALRRPMSPDLDIVVSGALGLPTASDDEGAFATGFALYPRMTDLVLAVPDHLLIRPHATALFRQGKLLAQAGGGLDIGISTDDSDSIDPIVRLGLGAAYDLGTVSIGGEWSALVTTGDEDSLSERSISTLALSARGNFGQLSPFGAIVIPLDEGVRDFTGVMLSIGLEYRLQPAAQ